MEKNQPVLEDAIEPQGIEKFPGSFFGADFGG
jgi:hypothetical protein